MNLKVDIHQSLLFFHNRRTALGKLWRWWSSTWRTWREPTLRSTPSCWSSERRWCRTRGPLGLRQKEVRAPKATHTSNSCSVLISTSALKLTKSVQPWIGFKEKICIKISLRFSFHLFIYKAAFTTSQGALKCCTQDNTIHYNHKSNLKNKNVKSYLKRKQHNLQVYCLQFKARIFLWRQIMLKTLIWDGSALVSFNRVPVERRLGGHTRWPLTHSSWQMTNVSSLLSKNVKSHSDHLFSNHSQQSSSWLWHFRQKLVSLSGT